MIPAASSLALTALTLARELDNGVNKATAKSYCAKALFDVMNQLRALKPPVPDADALDELTKRRSARLAR